MRTKNFTFAVSALTLAAACSASSIARAQAVEDEVTLLDGTTLRGQITQQSVGQYVVIRTIDGRGESIPWSQIKRVSALAAPSPALAPAPAPAPAPTLVLAPAATPMLAARVPSEPSPERDEPAASHDSGKELPVHLELGARTGYSFSDGDYANGVPIGSPSRLLPGTTGGLPIVLDLGVRIGKRVYFGAFFQYAFLATSCPKVDSTLATTASCGGHDLRGGIAVQLHLAPRGSIDPWIGFGVGHEWLTNNVAASASDGSSANLSYTLHGWDVADAMVGVDLHTRGGFAFGPYAEVTSGSFASASKTLTGSGQGASDSTDITATSAHQWFTVGLRGTFEIASEDPR